MGTGPVLGGRTSLRRFLDREPVAAQDDSRSEGDRNSQLPAREEADDD
jgi:hypothetical protein